MSAEENMDISNAENIVEQPAEPEGPVEVSIVRFLLRCLRLLRFKVNQQ